MCLCGPPAGRDEEEDEDDDKAGGSSSGGLKKKERKKKRKRPMADDGDGGSQLAIREFEDEVADAKRNFSSVAAWLMYVMSVEEETSLVL